MTNPEHLKILVLIAKSPESKLRSQQSHSSFHKMKNGNLCNIMLKKFPTIYD